MRRAIVGALRSRRRITFVYVPASHGIAESALAEFGDGWMRSRGRVAANRQRARHDSRRRARSQAAGCAVVLTLGGDGTNRAVALGWRDAPLLPISTGTNNVFPRFVEATVAGAAAGLIATARSRCRRRHAGEDHSRADRRRTRRPGADRRGADGERFVGARALLDAGSLRLALLTRADPAAVGITAIGGLIAPLVDAADQGLLLTLGHGHAAVRAPIAPGLYATVRVADSRTIAFGEVVTVDRPRRACIRRRTRTCVEAGPARAI